MKKLVAIISILAMFAVAGQALAVDKMINTKIDSVVTATDRNGATYMRLLVNEDRNIQGQAYKVTVPVLIFGNDVKKASTLKAGDTLKAIIAENEYQGRTSYTLRTFVK